MKFTIAGLTTAMPAATIKNLIKLQLPVNGSIYMIHHAREAQKTEKEHKDGILIINILVSFMA